ncbi:hypothetical protein BHF71_05465 [Vulcanibacillus modesticaldus]|uniref:(2Fe-2S)-binding protein n=1 Tax=Vulcanibacillus modesticaldus TaxID=337097 RepID=A0A1D2YXB0_9BACI|nr:(2Fe-2S)-binding protein [Vulcanibacillus modesticaldus]OEG00237.1 hypothetical protein BHF71_05465 [Vulcanibacillus modesticaldus]
MGCCDVPKEKINNDKEEISLCPVCKTEGEKVNKTTVVSLVKDEIAESITESKYWLCKNSDCEVVYYNSDTNQTFTHDQIKVPVWFKTYATPIYACYCKEVTKDAIFEAVLEKGANTLEDIQQTTGANTGNDCLKKNPRGKCCSGTVKQMLEEAKRYQTEGKRNDE